MRKILFVGASLLFTASLTACGSSTPAPTPAPSVIVVTVPAAAPTTEATTDAPEPAETTAAPPAKVKMPKLTSIDLQSAQDKMQEVTGNPVFYSTSHDLRGSRMQLIDSNWMVCTQNVKAGKLIDPENTDVDFGVVKREETCP